MSRSIALLLFLAGCTGLSAGPDGRTQLDEDPGRRSLVFNVTGEQNAWFNSGVVVEEGDAQLLVSLSGGAGDADLYVRHVDTPTLEEFDCRSKQPGNSEVCVIDDPEPGLWQIGVHGFTAYIGATLEWERLAEAIEIPEESTLGCPEPEPEPLEACYADASAVFFERTYSDDANQDAALEYCESASGECLLATYDIAYSNRTFHVNDNVEAAADACSTCSVHTCLETAMPFYNERTYHVNDNVSAAVEYCQQDVANAACIDESFPVMSARTYHVNDNVHATVDYCDATPTAGCLPVAFQVYVDRTYHVNDNVHAAMAYCEQGSSACLDAAYSVFSNRTFHVNDNVQAAADFCYQPEADVECLQSTFDLLATTSQVNSAVSGAAAQCGG